jgi:hypothetical protein
VSAEDEWAKSYYEHPLTAAASAILNMNGAVDEHGQPAELASTSFVYSYYKVAETPPSPPPVDPKAVAEKSSVTSWQ